jgi:uncharacterized glyoxalase superfamily protein PhnB
MKSPPAGWPRLSSTLFYEDANAAIAWLVEAFGFEVQLLVPGPDGSVIHSQLSFGEALIMVGEGGAQRPPKLGVPCRSPLHTAAANTQCLMLYVDDVDSHCAQARAAGATVIAEPALHDYGPEYWADRSYGCTDPDGHMWWFTQRVRDPQA